MRETARSETAIALAQKQFYPDFNVMVERFQNFGARDGFGGMVAVTLPFSFWTKPKYDAGVREARANLESAKAAYQALENQVAFEVKDVLVKIEATEKLVKLYKTTVLPQAQQTLDSARIAYQNAKVEFLTLLDAERGIRDFQLEYYRVLTALGATQRGTRTGGRLRLELERYDVRATMDHEQRRKAKVTVLVLLSLILGLIGGYMVAHDKIPTMGKGSTSVDPESQADSKATMKDMPGMSTPPAPPGAVVLPAVQQQLIGVRTTEVRFAPLGQAIRAVGTITYDERKLTQVNLRVSGWIRKVFVDAVGKSVRKGEPLLTLYSPDLLATQEEYLLALRSDRPTCRQPTTGGKGRRPGSCSQRPRATEALECHRSPNCRTGAPG